MHVQDASSTNGYTKKVKATGAIFYTYISISIGIWLLVLPFICTSTAYESVKMQTFFVGGIILVLFCIFYGMSHAFDLVQSDFAYIIFLVWISVVSISQVGIAYSLSGSDYRHQGVILFFLLWLVSWFIRLLPATGKNIFQKALVAGSAIESLYVLYEYFFLSAWKVYDYKGPLGTLGEPNATAAFIVFGLMFLDFKIITNRWMRIVLSVIPIGALLVLHSATADVMYVVFLCFIFFRWIYKTKKIINILYVFCFFLLLLTILYVYITPTPGNVQITRYWIWHISTRAVSRQPLFGFGLDTSQRVLQHMYSLLHIRIGGFVVERSHNVWLDIMLWSGIGGFGMFLWWIAAAIKEKNIQLKGDANRLVIERLLLWCIFASFHPVGLVHWLTLLYVVYL
jgi:exopolysaccharide production protein ExoQ